MNYSMSNKGDCRTDPATPGLLISVYATVRPSEVLGYTHIQTIPYLEEHCQDPRYQYI